MAQGLQCTVIPHPPNSMYIYIYTYIDIDIDSDLIDTSLEEGSILINKGLQETPRADQNRSFGVEFVMVMVI